MPLFCRLNPSLLALACTGLLLSGNANAETPAASAPGKKTSQKQKALPPLSSEQLLAQMFLSEIALSRGLLDDAAFGYKDLAQRTDDSRIQRRANEVELIRISQYLQHKPEEAEATFRQQLAERAENRAGLLLQLPAIYSRMADKQQALLSIQRLAAPYPGLAEAHYIQSLALSRAEQRNEAYAEALRAHTMQPDWAAAILQLAQIAPAERQQEVGPLLAAFIQRNPQELNARVGWIHWLLQDKNFAKANHEARKLLTEHPDNPALAYAMAGVAIETSDQAQAESILSNLIAQGWGELDQQRLILAQVQAEQGKYDAARGSLDKIDPGPLFLSAQTLKASLIAAQGKLDEARASLRYAATLAPAERPALLIHESQLLRQAKNNAAAFEVLNELLAAQPDHVAALYDSALLADQLELPDELEQRLRRVLEIEPDNAHANNALGYSLAERNTRLDEADQLLQRALKLSPEDPAILDSMGWLRFRQNRLQEAEQYLRKAFVRLPDPEVAAHLIEVLWQDGRKANAREEFAQALKASPDNPILLELGKRLKLN